MAAPPRPPTTAPASGLPAAAPTSAPPPAPMAPPVSARCPGVSPQAAVANASAAQTARYVIRDMSGSLFLVLRLNEEEHVQLHYGAGGACIPGCARRLLWRRCNSHCRGATSPQIRRVAAASARISGGFPTTRFSPAAYPPERGAANTPATPPPSP